MELSDWQVDEFVSALINYEKENIPEVCLKAVQPYLDDPEFDPEVIRRQSFAAAGLCAWVINIVRYYEVYCEVRTLTASRNDMLNAPPGTVESRGTVAPFSLNFRLSENCWKILLSKNFHLKMQNFVPKHPHFRTV